MCHRLPALFRHRPLQRACRPESSGTRHRLVHSTTGNYTETRFDDFSATTTCNETGTIYDDPYTVTATIAGNLALTETGNLGTGNYTVSGGGATPMTSSGSLTNAAITATSTTGGNPVTTTILKTTNWNTGVYNLTTTVNQTGGIASITITDQGFATAHDGTTSAILGATIVQYGDYKAGNYTVSSTTSGDGTNNGNVTNQTLSGSASSSGPVTATALQTGSVLTGGFDLNLTVLSNPTANFTLTSSAVSTFTGGTGGSALVTSTIHRWGNAKTGDYTVTATTKVTGSAGGSGANQGSTGSGTGTIGSLTTPTITNITETGNTQSGNYTVTSVTTGTLTATSLATIQSVNLSNATITSIGTITGLEFGNRKTGIYTIYEDSNVTSFTGPFTGSDSGTSSSGTITAGLSRKILDEVGNRSAGAYNNTVTIFQNVTISTSGTDPRGTFTATINTITDGVTVLTARNLRTGQYTADATITITSHSVQSGANIANSSYTDDTTVTSVSVTHDENNPVTGVTVANLTITTTTILNQVGDYLDSTYFTINTTGTTLLTSATVGNSVTTSYTVTSAYSVVDTETHAEGSDGTGGTYDFTKTSLSIRSWGETGTILSGAFTRTGTGEDDSTATEYNNYPAGSADFTEIINEDFAYTTTGNRVLGTYTDNVTNGTHDTTLTAHTHDTGSGWHYTVTQSTLGTFWRYNQGFGNGTYAHTEGASDDYTVTQSGADSTSTYDYLLTMTGTNSYSIGTSGNRYTGAYTTTKTGIADDYTITGSGSKLGGSYNETVTGSETYTQTDGGNSTTGLYYRQITGGGAYNRNITGLGAISDSGTTSYTWNQTGDPGSGTFNLTKSVSSSTRYDLLQDFKDISNTQSGQTPGHMNVYPFGQTFVDPFPGALLKVICGFLVGQPGAAPALPLVSSRPEAWVAQIRTLGLGFTPEENRELIRVSGLGGTFLPDGNRSRIQIPTAWTWGRPTDYVDYDVRFRMNNGNIEALLPVLTSTESPGFWGGARYLWSVTIANREDRWHRVD